MHYMTAGVLVSLVISNMNCLPEKFMGSQDNELNYSVGKNFVSFRIQLRYINVSYNSDPSYNTGVFCDCYEYGVKTYSLECQHL